MDQQSSHNNQETTHDIQAEQIYKRSILPLAILLELALLMTFVLITNFSDIDKVNEILGLVIAPVGALIALLYATAKRKSQYRKMQKYVNDGNDIYIARFSKGSGFMLFDNNGITLFNKSAQLMNSISPASINELQILNSSTCTIYVLRTVESTTTFSVIDKLGLHRSYAIPLVVVPILTSIRISNAATNNENKLSRALQYSLSRYITQDKIVHSSIDRKLQNRLLSLIMFAFFGQIFLIVIIATALEH